MTLYGCKEVENSDGTFSKHEGVFILNKALRASMEFYKSLDYSIQVLKDQIGIKFSDLISPIKEDYMKESCQKSDKRVAECSTNDTKNENTIIGIATYSKMEKKSFIPNTVLIFFVFGVFLVAFKIVVSLITQHDDDD